MIALKISVKPPKNSKYACHANTYPTTTEMKVHYQPCEDNHKWKRVKFYMLICMTHLDYMSL